MILGGCGDYCCKRVGDGEEQQSVEAHGNMPWALYHSPASFCLPLCDLQQPGDFALAEHTLPVASRSNHVTCKPQDVVLADVTAIISRTEPSEDSDLSECQSIDDCSEDESTDEDERDPIDVYRQLEEAAERVCFILVKKGDTCETAASGFLVGDCYLMTALHAVRNFLVPVNLTAGQACDHCSTNNNVFEQLEIPSNLSVEANFAFHDHDNELLRNGIRVLRRPRAILEELDLIVLEFDVSKESHEVLDFPKQGGFRSDAFDFSPPPMSAGHVYLIGHNQVSPKRINFSCKVKDLKYATLQLERYYSTFASDNGSKQLELYARDLSIVNGGEHVLIDCFFMHGASGCPIFRYRSGDGSGCGLKLAAMFLCGLPSGHYASRPSTSDEAAAYDKERRDAYKTFEGGVSMAAIRAALLKRHAELADELGWL